MALCLTNFEPIGIGPAQAEIYVANNGMIVEFAKDAQVIDCRGAWLSPGWADLHVHVWYGGTDFSIRASQAGLAHGVTAMADAGSAGEASFHGLREYVMGPQPETIKAFINIGSIGLIACNRVSELAIDNAIDVERTANVIEKNRDVICGIKARIGKVIIAEQGLEPLIIAKKLATDAGLPLMVHIGEAPPQLADILDILSRGDIITHCFHGKTGSDIYQSADVFSQVKELENRGILLDIGHGVASFDFEVARKAIADGITPFSISTDLHERNIDGPVFDLATTVSKLHALGLPFDKCVAAISTNPRSFMKLDEAPTIGCRADFTVFDFEASNQMVKDSIGAEICLENVFNPVYAIVGAKCYDASGGRSQRNVQ